MTNYTLQTYYNQGKQGAVAPTPAAPKYPLTQGMAGMARVPRQIVSASPRIGVVGPPDTGHPWWIPNKPTVIPGTPFAPSGNSRVNAWLAAGGQFSPFVAQRGVDPVNPQGMSGGMAGSMNSLASLYGGFIPAPFAASNAPYVPPSLPGAPSTAPGIAPVKPPYGFDNRYTLYG